MIAVSPFQPVQRPIAAAINQILIGGFNPSTLFASATGYIYDLNDLSTIWQDSAGTTAGNDSLYEVAA